MDYASFRLPKRPCACLWWLLGSLLFLIPPAYAAIDTVPAPADGIYDDTRALSDSARRVISQEFHSLGVDLKCDLWLTATSFSAAGLTPRRQAQATRVRWSGEKSAILLGYNRATNSLALSFSPDLWDRYPASSLASAGLQANQALANDKLTLDERLSLLVQQFAKRMRELETVRLQQTRWFPKEERTSTLMLVFLVVGGALIAAVLGLISRTRGSLGGEQLIFPDLAVSARFGAPFGGGLIAEVRTPPPGK